MCTKHRRTGPVQYKQRSASTRAIPRIPPFTLRPRMLSFRGPPTPKVQFQPAHPTYLHQGTARGLQAWHASHPRMVIRRSAVLAWLIHGVLLAADDGSPPPLQQATKQHGALLLAADDGPSPPLQQATKQLLHTALGAMDFAIAKDGSYYDCFHSSRAFGSGIQPPEYHELGSIEACLELCFRDLAVQCKAIVFDSNLGRCFPKSSWPTASNEIRMNRDASELTKYDWGALPVTIDPEAQDYLCVPFTGMLPVCAHLLSSDGCQEAARTRGLPFYAWTGGSHEWPIGCFQYTADGASALVHNPAGTTNWSPVEGYKATPVCATSMPPPTFQAVQTLLDDALATLRVRDVVLAARVAHVAALFRLVETCTAVSM